MHGYQGQKVGISFMMKSSKVLLQSFTKGTVVHMEPLDYIKPYAKKGMSVAVAVLTG